MTHLISSCALFLVLADAATAQTDLDEWRARSADRILAQIMQTCASPTPFDTDPVAAAFGRGWEINHASNESTTADFARHYNLAVYLSLDTETITPITHPVDELTTYEGGDTAVPFL